MRPSALERAIQDHAEAKRSLAVAERALLLIRSMVKTGAATVIWPDGQRLTIRASEDRFCLGAEQSQLNLYYSLRDFASMSTPTIPELKT